MRLAGRTALVTGSTRGLGLAIAKRLAAEGAFVAVSGRSEEQARRVAEEIVAAGGRAVGIAADVADPESAEALVQTAIAEMGRLDVLVNNAEIGRASCRERGRSRGVAGWRRSKGGASCADAASNRGAR